MDDTAIFCVSAKRNLPHPASFDRQQLICMRRQFCHICLELCSFLMRWSVIQRRRRQRAGHGRVLDAENVSVRQ